MERVKQILKEKEIKNLAQVKGGDGIIDKSKKKKKRRQ